MYSWILCLPKYMYLLRLTLSNVCLSFSKSLSSQCLLLSKYVNLCTLLNMTSCRIGDSFASTISHIKLHCPAASYLALPLEHAEVSFGINDRAGVNKRIQKSSH